MLKKFFIIIIMILLLVGLSGNVLAKDKYTATSTINGVTANWEYELNDSNQIENLKCTNASELTGNVTIPSTLDEKTVISIGNEAFKSATNITGVTVSNSIQEIGYGAFNGCNNLASVNLGQLEKISFDVFKNCPKLTTITIPKTLVNGPSNVGGVFTGTTNLTSVTFENGLTQIPDGILRNCAGVTTVTIPSSVTKINECAFQNSGLTEITIPSSVKEIDFDAFQDCSNLASVNLGQLEKISFDVFKNCPKLTTITIPKTLVNGPSNVGGVFTGTTNLTSVTFENGLTQIPDGILRNCAGVTTVTIPSSVTKINECAFQNSGLTEITIPSSVKEIDFYAFKDCEYLEKITILNENAKMGWFSSQPTKDSVFENHNENLTIYCYEDSIAAKYAIANNIKYVYLTKPASETPSDESKPDTTKPDTTKTDTTPSTKATEKDDTTIAKGVLPQTGATMTGVLVVLAISVASIIFFIKYRKFRDI